MAAPRTFSGGRAIFKVQGNPVAYAGGVSYSEEIDYQPVDVLNLLEVWEHVPVAYRCTLASQMFRVVGSSLKKNGIFPDNRSNSAMMTHGDFEATVSDSITNNTIGQFLNVRVASHGGDISARGVVAENVNFVAIKMLDESQVG